MLIDRPLGSRHPRHNFLYEVNYGFVPGTLAPDGEALDAYLLGVNEPVARGSGRAIAMIHRHDEDDDKLVIVPEGLTFGDDEIMQAIRFQEMFFDSCVLREFVSGA